MKQLCFVLALVISLLIPAYSFAASVEIPDTGISFDAGNYSTFVSGQTDIDASLEKDNFTAEYYQSVFDYYPDLKLWAYSEADDRQVQFYVHEGTLLCSPTVGNEYQPEEIIPAALLDDKKEASSDFDSRVEAHNGTVYYVMSGNFESAPQIGFAFAFCEYKGGFAEISIVDYENADHLESLSILDSFNYHAAAEDDAPETKPLLLISIAAAAAVCAAVFVKIKKSK